MIHRMNLADKPFAQMASGAKTIELRLFDQKRQKIQIGDTIIFSHNENHKEIGTTVTKIITAKSFSELFATVSTSACGFSKDKSESQCALEMRKYYSEEDEKLYGVAGIFLSICEKV